MGTEWRPWKISTANSQSPFASFKFSQNNSLNLAINSSKRFFCRYSGKLAFILSASKKSIKLFSTLDKQIWSMPFVNSVFKYFICDASASCIWSYSWYTWFVSIPFKFTRKFWIYSQSWGRFLLNAHRIILNSRSTIGSLIRSWYSVSIRAEIPWVFSSEIIAKA